MAGMSSKRCVDEQLKNWTAEELKAQGVGIYPEREYACEQCRGVAIFDDHHDALCDLTPEQFAKLRVMAEDDDDDDERGERLKNYKENYAETMTPLEYWLYCREQEGKGDFTPTTFADDDEEDDDDDDDDDEEVEVVATEKKTWFYPNSEGLYYCDICGNDPDQPCEHTSPPCEDLGHLFGSNCKTQ
ncbi:Hypothetical predicted protein [Paramuricea clavata]|uniref:Uncharacterized protein n=1 Tax=Paramuricea clavata TaxID=317549 RepID=A0A6S7KDS7_PARCT|nr:Hypothetical predicted protein [Paramuricea clavata]